MRTILTISRADFKLAFRDPIFKILYFFPFLAFIIIKWVLPAITSSYPEVEPYHPVILMWACMQSATMFGFIYGFLFLEEKEENVDQALRIAPVSTFALVSSRLAMGIMITLIVNYCLLHYGGIVNLDFWQEVLIAFQFSLLAPLMVLLLNVLAGNKIEGMAQMKVLNIILNLPALIYFLPFKAIHLTAIIPTYWSFRSIEAAIDGQDFGIFYLIGLIFYISALILLLKFYQRKALAQ